MQPKKPTPKAPAKKATKAVKGKQPTKAVAPKAAKAQKSPKPSNLDRKIANLTKEQTPAQVISGIRKDAQKAAAAGGGSPPKGEIEGAGAEQKKTVANYGEVLQEITRNFDLSDREARFVMEMAVDGNASAAYERAGYAEKNANVNASRLMAKDSVKAAVAHVRAKVAESTGFTAEEALQLAAEILRADTRELVEYKVSCCRYCYGDQHKYQRTSGEMVMARVSHDAMVARRKERNKDFEDPGFDEMGGEGFDLRRMPNTDCPACAGDGTGRVVIKDTRTVSKAAAALYAGVKESKEGVEVKFHDKAVMLDKMFRYHGLYEVDNRQKSTAAADPAALIALSEAMERSREQRLAIMEHRRLNGFTGD